MPKKHPEFHYKECISCGICVTACPVSALSLTKFNIDKLKKAYPELNGRDCIGCGLCGKSCPMQAIVMVESV